MIEVPDPFVGLADRLEAGLAARGATWEPLDYQTVPVGAWHLWALVGGRGIGKSDTGAHDMDRHALGPPCMSGPTPHRMAIIGPTLGDAVESCWKAPAGISVHNPATTIVTTKGGTIIRWPNGSEAKLFGAHGPDDVERLRAGGNRCRVWAEEAAAWIYLDDAWAQMELGLRLGTNPQVVMTTTPKPRKFLRDLLAKSSTVRSLTADGRVPTTDDNRYLAVARRAELYELFGGTRLGRQELKGEFLDDVPGAYWTWLMIERDRVMPDDVPTLTRVVVPVDPAATANEDSDETGITAVGKGMVQPHPVDDPEIRESHPDAPHPHYYVLEDRSGRYSPTEWATVALSLYDARQADRIIAETNHGGDMVVATIRAVRRTASVRVVRASRGKSVRAEPISALYAQRLVHHVGRDLTVLEDQMTSLEGATAKEGSSEHDDRLDSAVYGLTDLVGSGVAFMAGVVHHGRRDATGSDRRRRVVGGSRGYNDPRGEVPSVADD